MSGFNLNKLVIKVRSHILRTCLVFKYRAVFNTRMRQQRKHPAATSLLEFQASGGQVITNKRTKHTNTRKCCEEKLQGANKTYRNVSVRGVGKVPRGSDTF